MSPPAGTLVLSELVDGVGAVTLNRPERHNALNDEMSAELATAMHWALHERDVRCVLLRAEGRSFSSGRDTSQLGSRSGGESDLSFVRRAQDARIAALTAPKPVVAAVQGYVLGGAFEMALAADLRVAADDAVFAFPEIQFGLVPDTGGTQLVTMLAGPSKAKWLVISGERIDAATAHDWGLVDFVVARADLDDTAMRVARKLAAAPPQAAAMAKQLVDQAWQGTVVNGIRAELLAQTALFAGDEHQRAKAERIERSASPGNERTGDEPLSVAPCGRDGDAADGHLRRHGRGRHRWRHGHRQSDRRGVRAVGRHGRGRQPRCRAP